AVVYPQQQTTGPQVTFDNRPEMELVDLRRRLIAAQESLTVAEIQPKVNAFLTTGYGRPALNFLNDQFDFYAMAGIRIAVPLDHFYSRKIGLQKQSFRLEQESIQLDKADLVKRWSNEAVNYLEEMDKLRSWLKEDMEIIEMRQKILTIAQAQWEGGTLATAQYLNHISDLSLARIRLTTHEIMLEKTQSLLLNLIGASPDKN
ncbi:MAG: TolC family protein, partial [Saprospiraceae bacterium]|nr:TolC family protein [Saprospiraceae bacterium]